MPQSLNLTLVHLVFSTKDRMPFLTPQIRPDLFAYLATAARHDDGECYRIGGIEDHVHLAVRLSRTTSIADLVSQLKFLIQVAQGTVTGSFQIRVAAGLRRVFNRPERS